MKMVNKVTTEAVERATGKGWDEWIKILDREGAEKLTHKEIARLLFDKRLIKRQKGWPANRSFSAGWWCQMVTVGYEYAKGRRVIGETADQGFEIGVSKTLPIDKNKLWNFLFSGEGLKIWLGEVNDFKMKPKFRFVTTDGTEGEIRTIKDKERIRLVYEPKNFKKPSTLQLYLESSGEKIRLGFHQERLENEKIRSEMKAHWEKTLVEILRLTAVN